MDNKVEAIKIGASSFLGFLASMLGGTEKHLIALIIIMLIDTMFGWIKGFKLKEWKSSKARWGFAGKIVELMFIAVIYVLNWVFNIPSLIYIVIYYFILVEVASIIENYAEINQNLPKGLVDILKKFSNNIGTLIVKKIEIFLDKFK